MSFSFNYNNVFFLSLLILTRLTLVSDLNIVKSDTKQKTKRLCYFYFPFLVFVTSNQIIATVVDSVTSPHKGFSFVSRNENNNEQGCSNLQNMHRLYEVSLDHEPPENTPPNISCRVV